MDSVSNFRSTADWSFAGNGNATLWSTRANGGTSQPRREGALRPLQPSPVTANGGAPPPPRPGARPASPSSLTPLAASVSSTDLKLKSWTKRAVSSAAQSSGLQRRQWSTRSSFIHKFTITLSGPSTVRPITRVSQIPVYLLYIVNWIVPKYDLTQLLTRARGWDVSTEVMFNSVPLPHSQNRFSIFP